MSQRKPFAVVRRNPTGKLPHSKARLNLEHLEERVLLDATVIEDFSGDLSPYTTVLRYQANATIAPGYGHDGSNALLKGDGLEWLARNDSQVHVQQGETISAWIDMAGNADGRAYLGFGARPNAINDFLRTGGGLTLVLAANTNQLLLENNTGFGHANIGSPVPMTYSADHFYRAEVVWGTDNSITGNLYDSDGTTLLASVSGSSTAYTEGGIAFRAFGSDKYFDTVTVDAGGARPGAGQHPAVNPGHRPAHLQTQQTHTAPGGLLDPFQYQSVPGTGRQIWLARFDSLQQVAIVGGVAGLAATNLSTNHGDPNSYFGQMGWGPVTQGLFSNNVPIETPMLQEYIFRQRPGEATQIIGRSDVKHFFLSVARDPQQLRPTESDTYDAIGQNAVQDLFSPQADVDPVTGMISTASLDYFGENRSGGPRSVDGLNQRGSHNYTSRIDRLLQVNIADLDPSQNPAGTVWYLAGNIFTPGNEDVTHASRWVKIAPQFDGTRFTFMYPDGATGQYNVRLIPGLPGQPPQIISQTPAGSTVAPVATVEVTFSKAIDPTTFTPDKVTSFTGPNGAIAVTGVAATDNTNTVFDITFDSQSALGAYSMVIGPDIQDTDGLSMESAYTANFTIISNTDNLINNGGFETGTFSSWTQSGDGSFTSVQTSNVHSGTYSAQFGPNGPLGTLGYIEQTVTTTVGQGYQLTFWLSHPYTDTGMNTEFQLIIDGNIVIDLHDVANMAYTLFTVPYTATGATTNIKFGFHEPPQYFYLDDVAFGASAAPGPHGGPALGTALAVSTQNVPLPVVTSRSTTEGTAVLGDPSLVALDQVFALPKESLPTFALAVAKPDDLVQAAGLTDALNDAWLI